MISTNSTARYFEYKRGFKNGIELRTAFNKYLEKNLPKADSPKIESEQIDEAVNNYIKNTAKFWGKAYVMLVNNPKKWITEQAEKNEKINIIYESNKDLIADTFKKGKEDPCACYKAWYEAVYEHLVPIVLKLAGENTPIGAIINEIGKITKSLTDQKTAEAIMQMDKEMRSQYSRRDYKRLINEIKTQYWHKIDGLIDKAVAKVVNNHSAGADLPK